MPTMLQVLVPGENFIEGGTPMSVNLWCLDPNNNNKKVINSIERIVVHITNRDPLVFEEVTTAPELWDEDYMVLTKIVDKCTTEITYAIEYFVDVQAAADCCLPYPPSRDIFIESDGGERYITDDEEYYIL